MPDEVGAFLASPAARTIGLVIGVAVVAVWLAAAWWAYENAVQRTGHGAAGFLAAGWVIVSTPLLLPLALAVYAFARPGASASDRRITALAAELAAATVAGPVCPACRAAVDPTWLRCPGCATWLAAPCAACGEWSPAGLEICPYCAADAWTRPAAVEVRPAATALGRGRWSRQPERHAGRAVRRRIARCALVAGHEEAAAGAVPAAAGSPRVQRDRVISSARPRSYATSRESSSASS